MPRLYVISGHGNGDPGACGNGYQEAERVRALAQRIKDFGGDSVMLHPFSDNAYASNAISRLSIPKDYQIVELHMDSASAGARGGHVVINGNYAADEYDKALAKSISAIFPGRSKTLVPRTDLANPNRAAARGYSYRLVENGFISNSEDVRIFNERIDDLAKAYLAAFGIGVGEYVPPTPTAPSGGGSSSGNGADLGSVTVRYGLRCLNGGWLDEVTNFNNSNSNGFAGVPNGKHDYLYIKVDKGSVRYRVHIVNGGWLDWVYKGDKNDTVNGCAGVGGRAIDGVQIYYTTPDGYEYQQAWYRSQTTHRAGWLGVCCDDGNSVSGYDGWAGMYGEPLDRLQISIGTSNPF